MVALTRLLVVTVTLLFVGLAQGQPTTAASANEARLAVLARAHADGDVDLGPLRAHSVVIYLHLGGYVGGSPATAWPDAAYFGKHGWRVVKADYPLNNIAAARRYVQHLAQRLHKFYRHVVAYGDSAGGGLAALAAARGWVDAAVANSPVVTPWTGGWPANTTPSQRALNSASTYAGKPANRPLWLIVGTDDIVVNPAGAIALHADYPGSRLTVIPGGQHVSVFQDYPAAAAFLHARD